MTGFTYHTHTAQKNVFFFLVFAAMIFESCKNQQGAYYISQTGNDTNPGTKAKPFKTLQKINSLKLNPGDRIYLKGKEFFPGTLSLTINGTNDKPFLITSYENENGDAVIDGGNKEAVILRGNYFQLKDINVKGSGRKTGNTTNGITLLGAVGAVVENIKTEGFQKSGIERFDRWRSMERSDCHLQFRRR